MFGQVPRRLTSGKRPCDNASEHCPEEKEAKKGRELETCKQNDWWPNGFELSSGRRGGDHRKHTGHPDGSEHWAAAKRRTCERLWEGRPKAARQKKSS